MPGEVGGGHTSSWKMEPVSETRVFNRLGAGEPGRRSAATLTVLGPRVVGRECIVIGTSSIVSPLSPLLLLLISAPSSSNASSSVLGLVCCLCRL